MMTGPLLTATGITLISCTFLSKEVYIVTVFLSNILFGLGLGCYATPSTDTAVMNAPENKVGWLQGSIRWAVPGGAMGIAVTASLYALWLPMGTASAAQYALLFNSAICLGSAVVTGLYCQQQKPALSGDKISGNVQIFVRLHRQAPVAGDTGFNAQTGCIVFLADRL